MISKVEELRENLLHMVAGDLAMPSLVRIVDSLISVAHAEGVAEGVEQEAAKIVHCYECVGGDEHTPEKDQCMLWGEGKDCYCSRGKRVLAPTKERP